MIDPLNRKIDHVRISLTNKCNLDCFYCHGEGNSSEADMDTKTVKLRLDEALALGIKTVKFTGGEPLLRSDILEIIQYAKSLGLEDISMTTNGTRLPKLAIALKNAGLERVNIGCDAIYDCMPKNLPEQKKSIISARDSGLSVKVNMVVMTINQGDIAAMIDFCSQNRVNLQLIELIDLGNSIYRDFHVSLQETEIYLSQIAEFVKQRPMQSRNQYFIGKIFIETVRPDKNFCKTCNKIRIAASGKVKPCLMMPESDITISQAVQKRVQYGYG